MRIVVTGVAGTLGRAVSARLMAEGHDVIGVDVVAHSSLVTHRADLTEAWVARQVVKGADAVIHLSGVGTQDPVWNDDAFLADQHMLGANLVSGCNIFAAAVQEGVRSVVLASSETVFGAPFSADLPPSSLPLTDASPRRPTTAYSTSKALLEDAAAHASWRGRAAFVSLRFSIVLNDAAYSRLLPATERSPNRGLWNLWSYTDIDDAVEACTRGVALPQGGPAHAVVVAAPDTLSTVPTAELLDRYLPGSAGAAQVEGRSALLRSGTGSLLGWTPARSWTNR